MKLELSGSLTLDDTSIRHFTAMGDGDVIAGLRAELAKQHGAGDLTTGFLGYRQIRYEYTLRPNYPAAVDASLIDAVHAGRVALCNISSVKLSEGKYQAIDPADINAIGKVEHINRLEDFLKSYGKGTK